MSAQGRALLRRRAPSQGGFTDTDVARSLSVLSGGLPKTVTTQDSTTQTDTQSQPSATLGTI